MLNRIFFALILGLVVGLAPAGAQTPAAPSGHVKGTIKAARVQGHVEAIPMGGGAAKVLKDGDTLSDQVTIVTSPGSSIILAFSNGATVNLGGNSSLDVEKFEQDPFAEDVKLSDLKAEHGTSETKLNLSHGELVGKVVHLNVDKGSEFTVQTPVGAAGIRGTTFRIVFQPNGNGTATFAVTTQDGTVVYTGTTNNTTPISVPAGKEIVSTFNFTPATGTTPASGTPPELKTTDLSPIDAAIIVAASQQIESATINIIIPPVGNGSGTGGGGNPGTPNGNTPSVPTVPVPQTTPGAGST
jgi:hypothetical protein